MTELFIRGRKLNISYFRVPKDVGLNSTPFFIMKIPNKRELKQIALNHSADINHKDSTKIYRKCISEPYSFLVNDTTLPPNNPFKVQKEYFGINFQNHI